MKLVYALIIICTSVLSLDTYALARGPRVPNTPLMTIAGSYQSGQYSPGLFSHRFAADGVYWYIPQTPYLSIGTTGFNFQFQYYETYDTFVKGLLPPQGDATTYCLVNNNVSVSDSSVLGSLGPSSSLYQTMHPEILWWYDSTHPPYVTIPGTPDTYTGSSLINLNCTQTIADGANCGLDRSNVCDLCMSTPSACGGGYVMVPGADYYDGSKWTCSSPAVGTCGTTPCDWQTFFASVPGNSSLTMTCYLQPNGTDSCSYYTLGTLVPGTPPVPAIPAPANPSPPSLARNMAEALTLESALFVVPAPFVPVDPAGAAPPPPPPPIIPVVYPAGSAFSFASYTGVCTMADASTDSGAYSPISEPYMNYIGCMIKSDVANFHPLVVPLITAPVSTGEFDFGGNHWSLEKAKLLDFTPVCTVLWWVVGIGIVFRGASKKRRRFFPSL